MVIKRASGNVDPTWEESTIFLRLFDGEFLRKKRHHFFFGNFLIKKRFPHNMVFAESQICTTAFRRVHCFKMKYFRGALLQISKLNLHSRLWHLPKTASKIPKNIKYDNANGFDARCGLKKTSCCCCVCVCVLCGVRYSYGGCQSTTPGRVVQCVRRACSAVCVWLDHRPRSPGYYTIATSLKQTKHRGAASAAVDKAHGTVIDIAAAPCQSLRIWQHAFVGLLDGLASTRSCHMGRALVRDSYCCGDGVLLPRPSLALVTRHPVSLLSPDTPARHVYLGQP